MNYKLRAEQINTTMNEVLAIRDTIPTWQTIRYWQNRHIFGARFDWAKKQFYKHHENITRGHSVMANSAKKMEQARRICDGYAHLFCESFNNTRNKHPNS